MGKVRAKPDDIIQIPGKEVLLYIYYEQRRNVRVSLKEGLGRLHIPMITSTAQREKYLEWAKAWVCRRIDQNSTLGRSVKRSFNNGDTIKIMEQDLLLQFMPAAKVDRASVSLLDKNICLTIPQEWDQKERDIAIRTLLRKLISKLFYAQFVQRVLELNQLHFGKKINSIKLKYNKSNWGSCSAKQNLNFSIRLLFAPKEVIDYVIIHELAHLIEMSHSQRFWRIVESKDPDYKLSEKWLRDNDHTDFV